MHQATTILFVDDEPDVLQALQRTFYQSSDVIFIAPSAPEALQILQSHKIGVVVSDLHMPHMNGIDFLHQVRVRWPEIVRIALTGDGRAAAAEEALRSGDVFRYLTKPFDREHFEVILAQALEEGALMGLEAQGCSRDRPVFTLKLIRNLKDSLIEEGLIDGDRLQRASEVAHGSGSSLGEVLLQLGYIAEDQLLDFISRHANMPRVRLADMEQDPNVVAMVPHELLDRYHLLPLSRHGTHVVVAMADAANLMVLDEIKAFYGIEIEPVLCSEAELKEALSRSSAKAHCGVGRTKAPTMERTSKNHSDRDPLL